VVVWESLSESEQEHWSKKMGRTKDWVVWFRSRKKGHSVRQKVWWRQSNIKCAVSEEYDLCWVHQDIHVTDEGKAAFEKAAGVSGRKDECQV